MKKSVLFILLYLSTLLSSAHASVPYKDEGMLGEIRYSILTVKQFQKLYGNEWVLMDGSSIQNSDLHNKFGWNKIPDARGVFLRSKNYNRSVKSGNPDGDLDLGKYQSDELVKHNHQQSAGDIGNGTG